MPAASPAQRLLRWREARGLSRVQVAEMLDCDPSYLWMIEKGRKVPGRRIANAIERATKDAPGGPIRSEQWDRTAAHRDSVRPARAARQ